MGKRKAFIMTAMLMIGSWGYTFAQNERNVLPVEISNANNMILDAAVARQVSEQILFSIGESAIDPNCMDNAQRLDMFVKTSKAVLVNPDYVASRIQAVGTTSSDGQVQRNITLIGNNQLNFTKIDNGVDTLRGSGLSMSYELIPESKQRVELHARQQQPQQVVTSGDSIIMAKQAVVAKIEPSNPKPFRPLIALKTDLMLLGGVMPGFEMGTWTPNLSAELYFAHRWSVQAGFAYSNWNKFSGIEELYAVSVADMEMRHWFGKQSQFKGFYLGVYGQYGQYDVQKGIIGQTGSFWSGGLGIGWMQPLTRHWALDAGLRGGYRSAQNDIYDIEQGHTYFDNKQTNGKFTPQFRLQVVYRIGKTQK